MLDSNKKLVALVDAGGLPVVVSMDDVAPGAKVTTTLDGDNNDLVFTAKKIGEAGRRQSRLILTRRRW